jgi:hypothetical protein
MGVLGLALALPAALLSQQGNSGQAAQQKAKARTQTKGGPKTRQGTQTRTQTRTTARKGKPGTARPVAISTVQIQLAHQMVREAYLLGRGLEVRQRVALMTRLLYTMRPEVMAAEKREWAEEMFGLAQQLPRDEAAGGDGYAANAAAPAAGAQAPAAGAGAEAIAIAAARLAVYDADRALELLDELPSQGGREDARKMAARLVFAVYMQHHGAAGAQTLLLHGRRWGEHGGFPYAASALVLGRLRNDEDAAEYFFREVLVTFEREQEGLFGVCEFAGLLERAAAMEAISEEAAEEAGRNIVRQLKKFAEADQGTWTDEQKKEVSAALNNVRVSAPKAYAEASQSVPELLALRAERVAVKVEIPTVDVGLQTAFHELAAAMRERRGPTEVQAVIAQGLGLVNAKYRAAGAGGDGYAANAAAPAAGALAPAAGALAPAAGRLVPDAQCWALVSLAGNASPMTIATQLNVIEDPFWHAYFLAIAAQQVGEPTRVADPTSRKIVGKEEAEPE